MERKLMRLTELAPYCAGRVDHVEDYALKGRLESLGLTPGAEAVRLFSAAAGEPTAYSIRGSVIALRDHDAERVMVWA